MPDMPGWIAKGNILMALDNANWETLENIRQDLNDPGLPLDQIAANRLGLSEAAAEHLREDWFSPTGWWGFDASDVIRSAFIHAIDVINPGPKTVRHLDCYWVCARGDVDRSVQVAVSGTQGSVVVIIKTAVPDRAPVRVGTTPRDEPFRLVFGGGQAPYSPQYREI